MSSWLRLPRNADVYGLYLLLAMALLAPLASNQIIPRQSDHANHTGYVVEAKLALEEGQLPLRVAPFATAGLRYPLFQFYAQWPYIPAALFYKYATPENPWVAVKLTYLVSLWLGAAFSFKLAQLLGFDRTISVLVGVIYTAAPYTLINIHARAALVESFGQGLLPIIAYASARAALLGRPREVVWATIAWGFLGTSHLITFAYGTMFFGLFVAGLVAARQVTLLKGIVLLIPCALAWGLAAFQWYPPATAHVVQKDIMFDPYVFAWLTPLGGLLSFTSVPPEPSGRPILSTFLNPAVGLPILTALAGLLYFRRSGPWPSRTIAVSMILFAVAFFLTWSPFQFWLSLPPQLYVVQFSYRLLSYTTVFGTILAAYFLDIYRQRYGLTSVLPWLIGILAFTQAYLPGDIANERTIKQVIAAPGADYAQNAYEYSGEAPGPPPDRPLVRVDDGRRFCTWDYAVLKCTFNFDVPAAVQLPMLYYPTTLLSVTLDREPASYVASEYLTRRVVTIPLPAGRHRVFATFRGAPIANAISLGTLVVLGGLVVLDVMGRRRWLPASASARPGAAAVSTASPARS